MKQIIRTAEKVSGFLLDTSVVFSFDKTGFERHARHFAPGDLDCDLSGKSAAITGANSGIGFATAQKLAGLGADVHLLCRDSRRGEIAQARIMAETKSDRVFLHNLDVSSMASIGKFAQIFSAQKLDILINNAGVLPSQRMLTEDGFELTWATNLLGPFLLTQLLLPALARSNMARVVFVSSGGMYPQRLDLSDWNWERRPFDGVRAYANTKRALVVLNEMLAARHIETNVRFHAMHPGWVETPAVQSSLPRFHKVTRSILRDPQQGADTVVWLAAAQPAQDSNGKFWFDRRIRSTHALPFTKETTKDRETLWALLETQARSSQVCPSTTGAFHAQT